MSVIALRRTILRNNVMAKDFTAMLVCLCIENLLKDGDHYGKTQHLYSHL
jgi:hypothetical protein